MSDLIWELLWRGSVIAGILYALDFALDGKLDLPYWQIIEWEELLRRIRKAFNKIKLFVKKIGGM